MRRSFCTTAATTACTLAAILLSVSTAMTAEKPAPAKPKPGVLGFLTVDNISLAKPAPPPAPVCDKLKELGEHLGRALDVAVELLSGNEAALLSGNKTALLSGNSPTLLSGNTPKVLSGNQTPIFSGNTFSLLSNIKVEIHIENSGNSVAAPPPQPPANFWRREPAPANDTVKGHGKATP